MLSVHAKLEMQQLNKYNIFREAYLNDAYIEYD